MVGAGVRVPLTQATQKLEQQVDHSHKSVLAIMSSPKNEQKEIKKNVRTNNNNHGRNACVHSTVGLLFFPVQMLQGVV